MGHSSPDFVASVSGQNAAKLQIQRLQSLWSGYGAINRVMWTENGQQKSCVIKEISPPQVPTTGHGRKLKSYQAETTFYRDFASRLNDCSIPRLLGSSNSGENIRLALSDLSPRFPLHLTTLNKEETQVALEWLASFHSTFWEDTSNYSSRGGDELRDDGLWGEGCYWHLATRPEEFESIGAEWKDLKDAATDIDRILQGERTEEDLRCRTIVHGDFKTENLVWSADRKQVAAYDFQYSGGGLGTKDIAYLFITGVAHELVADDGDLELLRFYYDALVNKLDGHGHVYTWEKCKEHYKYALLDYVRFMAGWGWWGNTKYAQARAREWLRRRASSTLEEEDRRDDDRLTHI